MSTEFVVCVSGDEADDLEAWKVYSLRPDARAAELGCLRVVDESGEDYLYAADRFEPIMLSASARRRLETAEGGFGLTVNERQMTLPNAFDIIEALPARRGCSEAEIEQFEASLGVCLPTSYRRLLIALGRQMGRLFGANDECPCDFDELLELQSLAREVAEESKASFCFSPTDVIFSCYQGFQFLFFRCEDRQSDPLLFHYIEGAAAPRRLDLTLGQFIAGAVVALLNRGPS